MEKQGCDVFYSIYFLNGVRFQSGSIIPAYRLYRSTVRFFRSPSRVSRRASRVRVRHSRRARVSPAKLALGRIGIFRTASRASSKGLASSRDSSSTRTRFNTRDARGVTCDTDRPLAR